MKFNLPGSGLLSFSGMSTFLSCPRKYAYRYIDKVEAEDTDTSAMDRGKAFHKLVEKAGNVGADELELEPYDHARVTTAYKVYENLQINSALPVLNHHEVRIIDEQHQFIGYIDGVGIQESGKWYLGEVKTTASFDPIKWATLATDYQIALYSNFCGDFAHEQFLAKEDLRGVSYRTIVMTKKRPLSVTKKRLTEESPEDYASRIAGDAKVYHQMVVPLEAAKNDALQSFAVVKDAIHGLRGDSKKAHKNPGNCRAYNRPCEFFEHCWQVNPLNDETLDIADYNLEEGA